MARFSPASTLLELGDWQRTDYRCFAHPEKDGGLNLGSFATNAVFHHAEDGDGSLRESEDILKGFGSSGLTDPDSVPQVTDQPVTRLGDIWLLEDHLRPAKAGNRLPANRKTSANTAKQLPKQASTKPRPARACNPTEVVPPSTIVSAVSPIHRSNSPTAAVSQTTQCRTSAPLGANRPRSMPHAPTPRPAKKYTK